MSTVLRSTSNEVLWEGSDFVCPLCPACGGRIEWHDDQPSGGRRCLECGTDYMLVARGRPTLRRGAETTQLHVRIAAPDKTLIEDGARKAGFALSEYVRDAAIVRACEELGLDPLAYLETGERQR